MFSPSLKQMSKLGTLNFNFANKSIVVSPSRQGVLDQCSDIKKNIIPESQDFFEGELNETFPLCETIKYGF